MGTLASIPSWQSTRQTKPGNRPLCSYLEWHSTQQTQNPAPQKRCKTRQVFSESLLGKCREHEGEVGVYILQHMERLMKNLFWTSLFPKASLVPRTVPKSCCLLPPDIPKSRHCLLTALLLWPSSLSPPHLSSCCCCCYYYLLQESVLMTSLLQTIQPSSFSPDLYLHI